MIRRDSSFILIMSIHLSLHETLSQWCDDWWMCWVWEMLCGSERNWPYYYWLSFPYIKTTLGAITMGVIIIIKISRHHPRCPPISISTYIYDIRRSTNNNNDRKTNHHLMTSAARQETPAILRFPLKCTDEDSNYPLSFCHPLFLSIREYCVGSCNIMCIHMNILSRRRLLIASWWGWKRNYYWSWCWRGRKSWGVRSCWWVLETCHIRKEGYMVGDENKSARIGNCGWVSVLKSVFNCTKHLPKMELKD